MDFIISEIVIIFLNKIGRLIIYVTTLGKVSIDKNSEIKYTQYLFNIKNEENFKKLWNGYKYKNKRYVTKEFSTFIGFISLIFIIASAILYQIFKF